MPLALCCRRAVRGPGRPWSRLLRQQRLQPDIRLVQTLTDVVVQRQRLREHEQVLVSLGPGQGAYHLGFARLDAAMPVPSKQLRVAFARHDGTQEGSPDQPHDIADHFGQLDVHLHQRLLHALGPADQLGQQQLTLAGNHPGPDSAQSTGDRVQPHDIAI